MTSVLVVDDSQFMRTVIGNALADHGYEVLTATDGEEAVEAVLEHEPAVVTMDVEMPGMDGIEATEEIMRVRPTRILMLSASTMNGADATLDALSRGAVDFLPKTGEEFGGDIEALQTALLEKVEAVEAADLSAVRNSPVRRAARSAADAEARVTRVAAGPDGATETVDRGADAIETAPAMDAAESPTIVVGASTGGPRIVERILTELPADLDARVLVVQHMPASFTDRLATRLDQFSRYDVREASDGARVEDGEVLIAKGGYHMEVVYAGPNHLEVALTEDDRLHGVRPAIDVTMETAADEADGPLVGVALSGMGKDAAVGISAIKAAGGRTIAQDEDSSVVYGIPQKAIETGDVDDVVAADRLVDGIVEAVSEGEIDG